MAALDVEALEGFILRLGEALHRFGTPSDQLEDILGGLCGRLGLRAHVLITPTSLTACFGEFSHGRVHLIRCNQGDTDLARLSQMSRIADAVIAGQLSPQQAQRAIDAILAAPSAYGLGTTLLAYAAASGAVAQVLGGGLSETVAATLIGGVMGLLVRLAARSAVFGRVFDLVAPFTAAWLGLCFTYWLGPYGVRMAILAGLIVLVPGMAATTALTELARGHLVAGTSRLMGALATFMKLGFGVALGTKVAQLLLHPAAEAVLRGPPWTQWPALGVAALAIGVVLQAEARDVAWIVLCALVGFFGLRVGAHLLGNELAPCVAAFSVTCFSNVYARTLARTASVTQVPAMLLLVPGAVGYRSVAALMQNDVLGGMQAAFTMGIDAMALVAGTLLAGLLLSPRKDV